MDFGEEKYYNFTAGEIRGYYKERGFSVFFSCVGFTSFISNRRLCWLSVFFGDRRGRVGFFGV